MKKHIILILAMILLLAACNANPLEVFNEILSAEDSGESKRESKTESERITQMSNDIIQCFTQKDKEALKALFCEQVQNSPGFEEEIDKAFEYCKCDVYITSTIKNSASGGSSQEHGKVTKWYVSPKIPYFEIMSGSQTYYYAIYYYWLITYKADETLEGLHRIRIELLNVDSVEIGERLA